ncbi:LOW QUALITY PROTEIN: nitric oxide synthase-interacting protein-like [Paramacrobiotus metropolitanus]|uniref:LOW QUALITY PROTEIN: nitric oxide synthase-interacting protein-like n=1 Tax=Paramacrobiotus metropolitanus TaxID=2943436 RepID=UPI00244632CC|nr:LOW QUALITY PROTEIN: nitric oxide synthase-interacting protein-like [Paramacrobiotus metropolitanus]
MGKRHGKNATANPVYSYAELKKDNRHSGYGLVQARLGKDSIKDFDCCSLTLQPCRNPVVTPDGYLFDKEAILEYIVQKKLEIAKKQKAYEKWRQKKDEEKKATLDVCNKANVDRFRKATSTVTTPGSSTATDPTKPNNFWGSAAADQSLEVPLEKPDTTISNPLSGKPIKASDLIPINFTPMVDDDKTPLASKKVRYMCAVTRDALTNSVPCVVLRTSGNVVTVECLENLIKKDMIDPINGKKLTERDIIYLQRGGSSYAGSGVQLESKVSKPSMSFG